MPELWRDLDRLLAADPVKGAVLSRHLVMGVGEPMFRFALWRIWNAALPLLAVVMLNPSTANATSDDQTIRRLVHFGKREGYGGILVGNRYAYRATDPMQLFVVGTRNAIGPDNRDWLRVIVTGRDVLVAWGAAGIDDDWLLECENLVAICGRRKLCLGTTRDGFPRHPARLGNDVAVEPWDPSLRRVV